MQLKGIAKRAKSRPPSPSGAVPRLRADWPETARIVTSPAGERIVALEADRLTTGFGRVDSKRFRIARLPPMALLADIARLDLIADPMVRTADWVGVLEASDCEITHFVDPIASMAVRQSQYRARGVAGALASLPSCDVIIFGGRAVDIDYVKGAREAIERLQPVIVLRSPHDEAKIDEFATIISPITGYQWLSHDTLSTTPDVGPNAETIAIAWPTARLSLAEAAQTGSSVPHDIFATADTRRPEFRRCGSREVGRPHLAYYSIESLLGTGLWDLEHHGEQTWRWGGRKGAITLYFEVPWPGRYRITLDLFTPIADDHLTRCFALINGVESNVVHDTGKLIVDATLFRHCVLELHVPPLAPSSNDSRQLSCAIEGLAIQEIVR